jgi:hypothetical protein
VAENKQKAPPKGGAFLFEEVKNKPKKPSRPGIKLQNRAMNIGRPPK